MSNKKPLLLFFAGPNGSGKSTITQYFDLPNAYTNADDVVASVRMSNLDAAKMVDRMRMDSIRKKEDFSFETVLSSDYKIKLIREAKKQGYFIKGIYVLTIDPNINVARVRARSAAGGHSVDKKKVIERYYRSIDNIKELMELCDILHIYDNTVEPVRIVRKRKESLTVFPNNLWDEKRIFELIGVA